MNFNIAARPNISGCSKYLKSHKNRVMHPEYWVAAKTVLADKHIAFFKSTWR